MPAVPDPIKSYALIVDSDVIETENDTRVNPEL